MKQGFVWLALALFALAAPVSALAQDTKIGLVDLQRIINESARGKEAKEMLQKESEFKSRKLREGDDSLKKKFTDLEKQRTVLSPEAFEKRQTELLTERDKFAEMLQSYQTELRRKEAELTQDIVEDVQEIVKGLAESEKFTLVFEKSEAGVLYFPPKFDLTERVLQLYDKKAAGGAKKK